MGGSNRLFLALILTASGLGLALYATYVYNNSICGPPYTSGVICQQDPNKTLGVYLAILGTIIFIVGLLLLTVWQFRAGTASPSRR